MALRLAGSQRSSRLAAWILRLALCLVAAAGLASPAMAARGGTVALTFDDLPGLTILRQQSYVDAYNKALLAALVRHHFPAIGFVNEGKLDPLGRDAQIATLKRWTDAGMALGNHSYSHGSPKEMGADAYVADIARGEPVVRTLLAARGQTLRWYRHPYLETGYPLAVKQQIDGWLGTHGYRTAPVTIDADDWEFAEPYDDAILRSDREAQRRILDAYIAYTAVRVDWAQRSARALFGRDIAHVMLLHCTRLNADAFDRLAALLRRARLRPVTLEQAMRDPAYATPDRQAFEDGIDWLSRWAAELGKTLPSQGDVDPPAWLKQDYDRVDRAAG